jgi:hypothetical protein
VKSADPKFGFLGNRFARQPAKPLCLVVPRKIFACISKFISPISSKKKLGASLSNVVAGFVVQRFDYPTGFMTLAAIAIIALGFFAFLMPETGSQHRTTADLSTVGDGARVRTND